MTFASRQDVLLALRSGVKVVGEFRCDRQESTLPKLYGCNELGDLRSVERALKNSIAR